MRRTESRASLSLYFTAALCLALITSAARAEGPGTAVDFARDVQPILADNCYLCHGPDIGTRKADLRLDTLDPKMGPFVARDGYSIITPGKLDDSVMVMRITSDDPETKMPPPSSHRTLKPGQVDTIKRWIEQGAKWGKHWSFDGPVRHGQPETKDKSWARNAIDRFLLARLEKEGLKPSPEASRETLIRRVTLDLTGLPPTPAEVDAFVKDPSSDAYEKVVDRLLASPRYGERMVWEWLDASRYADTNGYQADPTRTSWPWRDWVVRAMNANMPFDQFLTWQLAGDLLPNATEEQQLATAFNRNHPYNGEGGRIAEETRVENVMDRTDTAGTVFLGLTVGCAKCHDHKYDPISQKEYYSLYAYFNQSSEKGTLKYDTLGNAPPTLVYKTAEQAEKLATLKRAAKEAADKLAAETPKIDAKQPEWEKAVKGEKGWTGAEPVSATSAQGASMQIIHADGSVLAYGNSPENDVVEVVLRTDLPRVTGLRVDPLPDASLPQHGPGRSPDSGNFVLTHIEAVALSVADPTQSRKVRFASADATFSQEQWNVAGAIDDDPTKTGWAVWKAPDPSKLTAVFGFAEPVTYTGGTELRLRFHYASAHKQHTMGRMRLSLTDGSVLPPDVAETLALTEGQRSEDQKNRLRDYHRTRVGTGFKPLADASAAAAKAVADFEASLPRVMVMNDATTRPTHLLVKSAYDKPADEVQPGVPAVLPALPESPKNNRLALAKWLTDPGNPLTARVTVNRYWQQFFGVGIVKTVDDFGLQGERPVHPQLLDWLAVEFRESGWDVKALHRLIVTSAAYRQSSKATPELLEKDPENRLLARGPRFRMASAMIRDQALAASGLLVEQLGGAPVKPYQPPGIWEEATFGFIKYEQDHGASLYRRSLYTFWRRIVGPVEFFDTQSRSNCTVKSSRTNTPLHALTTLNNTTFVEAARVLAQRVMTEPGNASAEGRIRSAYRFVLARGPSAKEESVFLNALARLRTQYAADPAAAKKLLAVGESKRDESLDPIDHAAYTAVCLALLNTDEALTKE